MRTTHFNYLFRVSGLAPTEPEIINPKYAMSIEQRFKDWQKDNPNGTFWEFDCWCGEEYQKEINAALATHHTRNKALVDTLGHGATINELRTHIKNAPKSMSRSDMGDVGFNAYLTLSGVYNSLMAELSRDEMNEEWVKGFLDTAQENLNLLKPIL